MWGIDNFRSTFEVTKKLIKLQLKNIVFIGYPDINYTIKERKTGYKTALSEVGIYNKSNILQVQYHSQPSNSKSIYDFLNSLPSVDGIICVSTVICHEVLGCLNEINPENIDNIKIITYDDNKWYNFLNQKVSAIKTPTVNVATVSLGIINQQN